MRRQFPAAAAAAATAALIAIGIIGAASEPLRAQSDNSCAGLPTYADLKEKLYDASFNTTYTGTNRGFGNNMWATIVNRDGVVCAVAFTGGNRGAQWPGSRVISAQKANTRQRVYAQQPGTLDRESLSARATGRQPLRAAGKQSGGDERRV